MKAKPIIAASVALSALVVLVFLVPRWREYRLLRQSLPIQASLENYRQREGRYPDSLDQIGMTERLEGPIFYERETETSYRLWFGTTLGESKMFYSTDHQWR